MQKYAVPLISLALGVIGAQATVYVKLQSASPGVKENGNINVSGNVISGKVMAGLSSSQSIITSYSPLATTTAVQGTARNFGVRGQTTAPSGLAYGGYFDTTSPNGYGAWLKNKATSGNGLALFAETAGGSLAGEFLASNPTALTTGLKVSVLSSNGGSIGAYIDGKSGYGTYSQATGSGGWGVYGIGSAFGVYGSAPNGSGIFGATGNAAKNALVGYNVQGPGHAVFANGTSGASGTKSLMIDHPDDPENKYLLQFCAEGDTPQLQYRGTVKLDGSGSASVDLPSYFDKINRDPICQLTAVGASMPNLYVAEKVKNNRFRIAGGKPGAEVFWTVIGIRNDKFMQKYGAKTEMDKPAERRGTYLMPALYGKSIESSEFYSEKMAASMSAQGQSNSNPPPKR